MQYEHYIVDNPSLKMIQQRNGKIHISLNQPILHSVLSLGFLLGETMNVLMVYCA